MRVIGREIRGAATRPRGETGPAATRPTAHLGHYRARDGSRGEQVGLDLDSPHVGLVVGKRGSGKSYTLGVLAEALARAEGVAPVLADPMGVFGTLTEQVTGDAERVPARIVDPRVPADALDPRGWCTVLGLDPGEGAGTLVWQAAAQADTLARMTEFVAEASADDATRRAARNHLRLADSWGVFGEAAGPDMSAPAESLFADRVTVLDLAGLDRGPMSAVLAGVARQLYDARVAAETNRLPWLLVDEAHAFFGGVADAPLRMVLTRGRQPGVSLVAATQRPSALPDVAISQSDLLVTHRLTSRADRGALSDARPAYMSTTLAERMPTDPGEALIVDDATESVHAVQVRERDTPHGGESPTVSGV